MKSNFNSNLFDKKIKLEKFSVFGGGTGCTDTEYTEGGSDERTTYYDENGNVTKITYCHK